MPRRPFLWLVALTLICMAFFIPGERQATVTAQLTDAIFRDATQPTDVRVKDLIRRMSIEEKALALFHNAPAIERVGLPFWGGWNQCLHGVFSNEVTTLYPVPIAQAATWDTALVNEVTSAISDEGRALYNVGATGPRGKHGLVYRAPVINIARDPRWGRIQECFGEDPFLCSKITVAYVKGLQGNDPKYLKVASTLKHFAVNNQETDRMKLEAQVPERMLHEYWLPHFKAGVVEGKATSLMASYNGINGTPNAVNKLLLTDILRDRWGFEGFVTSDLTGIKYLVQNHKITTKMEEAVAKALNAGCDIDDAEYRDFIPVAVKKGLLDEKTVDQALTRYLTVAFRLGVFDPAVGNPYSKIGKEAIDSPEHKALALKTARESIVLLTNKDNFLPLTQAKIKKVAIIGPAADKPEFGNYYKYSPKQKKVTPLQGLQERFAKTAEVTFARGCDFVAKGPAGDLDKAVAAAKDADVVFLCLGTNANIEKEGLDRKQLGLPAPQEELLKAVVGANPKTVVVLLNAGPLAVAWAKDNAAAVLEAWYPGQEGGHAMADVVSGDYNPAGRLPYTVYASTKDVPPMTEYDITKGFTYMYFKGEPVYPFGHGLSYTKFAYSGLSITEAKTVKLKVKNVGDRDGDEVVQLYVHAKKSAIVRPSKALQGFARIHLKAGEERTVTLDIPGSAIQYYDVKTHDFVVDPGDYEVMVGGSSAAIQLHEDFEVVDLPHLWDS